MCSFYLNSVQRAKLYLYVRGSRYISAQGVDERMMNIHDDDDD